MDGYDKLINTIKNLNPKGKNIYITTMDSPTSCKVNNLPLESDDLLIAEHLTTGWLKDGGTFIEPLKEGDIVLLIRLDDTRYIVLERLVSV